MIFRLLKMLFVSLCLWGISSWQSNEVPSRFAVQETLLKDPLQTVTTDKPFRTKVNQQTYEIEPVYDYNITGLVVSDHDSASWKNISHKVWGDYINTKDVCVIWGKNISNPHLSKLNFSNGNWTCYVQTRDSVAWQNFDMERLSNNHLIPASPELKQLIANSHVGDEVNIKGNLVNYSINGGPQRKTSTVRNDRDNGACEIIYVKEFSIVHRNNQFWIRAATISKWLSVALIIAMLALQIRFHLSFRQDLR